jgi:hypothetical protein
MTSQPRVPLGIKLLSAFFAFGAGVCLLTTIALLFPGGALEPIWRLNPEAQVQFQKIGQLSILLMFVVGSACGLGCNRISDARMVEPPARAWHSHRQSHWRSLERVCATRSADVDWIAD